MTNSTPASNPCRAAYIDRQGPGNNRMSFDPATTLMTVLGITPFWSAVTEGTNSVNPKNGSNKWLPGPRESQSYVVQKVDPSVVGDAIDKLLVALPQHTLDTKL